MKQLHKVVPLLVIVALLFAGAACQRAAEPTAAPEPTAVPAAATATSAPEPEPEPEAKVFKLGVMGPFSGAAARTGEEFRGAVEMAFEGIDYTIGDYTIELVWIDSQSDPAKATEAYEEAVTQKGIQAGLLNWHSSVSVAVMEITAKHQIPHFFAMGATEVVNETWQSDPDKYFYWVGKGWSSPAKLAKAYVQAFDYYIDQGTYTPDNRTAALWGEETDWGRSFNLGLRTELEAAGWEVLMEEYLPLDQTEFYPLLNRVKEMNPAIFAGTGSAAPMYSALIKQADEVGLESLIVVDGLGWAGEWYELTGSASNYVVDQMPELASPAAKAFVQEFESKYSLQPSAAAGGQAYDYARMFIDVAQKVFAEEGELTSENLAAFAKNEVLTGNWSFKDGIVHQEYLYTPETAPDPVVGKGYWMFPVLQYFDGDGKIIFPPEWAEQPLVAKGADVVTEVEATETFKLGMMGPLSGPNARTGQEMLAGVEMAVEEIGGQIGKYNIELVPIDSQSDPAKGAEAYEEAIVQKGIQAGIMNWHSSVAVGCMEIAAKHKIPHFFGLGATTVVNEMWQSDPDTYFYWLKGWPDPPKLSELYVSALEDAIDSGIWSPEAKTVVVWGEETDWGRSFGEGAASQFEAAGWTVVDKEYYPLDQTEFVPLLNRWKQENPAVCIGTGSVPAMYSSLIKQSDEVDLPCVMVADGLGWVGEWYEMSGDSSDYVVDQIPGFATEAAKAFAEAFEAKTGMQPSPSSAGLSYDYARFFLAMANEVYRDTGELTSETIADFSRNKLQTGEWTYTDGIIMDAYKFDANSVPDPVVGKGYFMFPVLQYFDGEGKVIFPPEWAEQELVPLPAGAE